MGGAAYRRGHTVKINELFDVCKNSGNHVLVRSIIESEPEGSAAQLALLRARARDGNMLIHYAASQGHLKVVMYLVEKGLSVEEKGQEDATPLHWAANNNHLPVVQYLVVNKARLDAPDSHGRTPLHLAAYQESYDVIEYLVQSGAPIGVRDLTGRTPLDLARISAEDRQVSTSRSTLPVATPLPLMPSNGS